jgi:uncharacterized protein YbjT (DUF2867 family)
MNNMAKTILVTGATGKQGGAVINALLASPSFPPYTILALTRTPTSAAAQKLAAKSPTIKLIAGNLDNPSIIFTTAATPIWGVFSVQVAFGRDANPESEERQSKALVDAALQHDVKHLVYTSVDRHGVRSDSDGTNLPQFACKLRCEKYLQEKCARSKMAWTILRPVCFMENFTPDFMGRAFASMWKFGLPATKSLQLIATTDIGFFAAQAFLKPEDYRCYALSLAGDELTFAEAESIFIKKTSTKLPRTFDIVAWGLLWGSKELRSMFKWFADVGYAADVVELRKMHPGLMNLGNWLEKESEFMR